MLPFAEAETLLPPKPPLWQNHEFFIGNLRHYDVVKGSRTKARSRLIYNNESHLCLNAQRPTVRGVSEAQSKTTQVLCASKRFLLLCTIPFPHWVACTQSKFITSGNKGAQNVRRFSLTQPRRNAATVTEARPTTILTNLTANERRVRVLSPPYSSIAILTVSLATREIAVAKFAALENLQNHTNIVKTENGKAVYHFLSRITAVHANHKPTLNYLNVDIYLYKDDCLDDNI
ncbi:unnamed protein product [Ceratitis capitata]|uniref:(Mediterranean fruit fly) hypothetical protein n=1 Tax=Ceratitis capitata TaxID=7213 RepID=A0A811UBA4_CERCA|nr:unnamed protein product [Ceratitis capitata]